MIKNKLRLIKLINWYPPYWAAGIRVKEVNKTFTRFKVQLKLRWYNKNMFGTQFGGSLYSMTDPFYVFIIAANFGNNYIVWDKSAEIIFIRPGKSSVYGVFEISKEKLSDIKTEVDQIGRKTYYFTTDIIDEKGKIIAKVTKEVYIRRK